MCLTRKFTQVDDEDSDENSKRRKGGRGKHSYNNDGDPHVAELMARYSQVLFLCLISSMPILTITIRQGSRSCDFHQEKETE